METVRDEQNTNFSYHKVTSLMDQTNLFLDEVYFPNEIHPELIKS